MKTTHEINVFMKHELYFHEIKVKISRVGKLVITSLRNTVKQKVFILTCLPWIDIFSDMPQDCPSTWKFKPKPTSVSRTHCPNFYLFIYLIRWGHFQIDRTRIHPFPKFQCISEIREGEGGKVGLSSVPVYKVKFVRNSSL